VLDLAMIVLSRSKNAAARRSVTVPSIGGRCHVQRLPLVVRVGTDSLPHFEQVATTSWT
jgi:hypothetical protein